MCTAQAGRALPPRWSLAPRLRRRDTCLRVVRVGRGAWCRAERLTEGNAGMLLSVAVAYGASHDLAAAARRIAALAVQGQLQPDMVSAAGHAVCVCARVGLRLGR